MPRHRTARTPVALVVLFAILPLHAATFRVSKNASGTTHDGLTWPTAFLTVQAGINAASSGDEVWVARPDPAALAYQEQIVLKSGITVLGGFFGTELTRFFRNPTTHVTTLKGTGAPVVSVPDTVTTAAVLDGFTITGGSGSGSGGVHCNGVLSLIGNIVTGNSSFSDGAGVDYANGSSGLIANNLIHSNTAFYTGAGIHCLSSNVSIFNNTVIENTLGSFGPNYGAGIYLNDTTAVVRNNVIEGNTSGFYAVNSTVTLTNNDVFENRDGNNALQDYQNVLDPSGANGNIKADPHFAGALLGNYRLGAGSPCIDAGDDSVLPLLPVDLDGKARKIDVHVDIGAYEFSAPVAAYTTTDLSRAVSIFRGGAVATPADLARLNINNNPPSDGKIDLIDIVGIVRKLMGLDPNP